MGHMHDKIILVDRRLAMNKWNSLIKPGIKQLASMHVCPITLRYIVHVTIYNH